MIRGWGCVCERNSLPSINIVRIYYDLLLDDHSDLKLVKEIPSVSK